jgi:phosphatidate cytidylyltransferase
MASGASGGGEASGAAGWGIGERTAELGVVGSTGGGLAHASGDPEAMSGNALTSQPVSGPTADAGPDPGRTVGPGTDRPGEASSLGAWGMASAGFSGGNQDPVAGRAGGQEPSMSSPSPHEAGSEGAGPSRPADPGSPPSSSSSRGGSVEQPPLTPPQEGITVTGGTPELPHWTDPPTGEVPRILTDDASFDEEPEDDLEAWNALGSRGIRWRDEGDDWDDVQEFSDLASDVEPVGALDQTRTDHSDLYSFDEEFERVEAERTGSGPVLADFGEDGYDDLEPDLVRTSSAAAGARARRARPGAHRSSSSGRPGAPAGRADDDLGSRVVVGVAFIILLAIAYAIGSKALLVLATAVVAAAAAEAYGMLQRSGFRPATLLGLVSAVGLMLGAYWKGIEALPLAVVLVFAGAMAWYLLRIVEARPLANVAVTTMAFVWVALLGSYASLMLRAHHGRGLLLGAVIVAVAADIAAFVTGRWIGSRPIAANISPGKTMEGFVGGLVVALIAGAIIGKEVTPWGGTRHGLLLGLIIGLVAPAGDLFESMIKRDLGVKDSGTILPGHGGLLDRFDSMLLVLPAAYYLAWLLGIVK